MSAPNIPVPFEGTVRSIAGMLRAWGGDFCIMLIVALVGRRRREFMGVGKFWNGQRYGFDAREGTWWLSADGGLTCRDEGRGFLAFARALYGEPEGKTAVALMEALDGCPFDQAAKDAIARAVDEMIARRPGVTRRCL